MDAHIPVAGAVIDDSFEGSPTCDGWSPGGGATALPASPGHTGARSCLLCGQTAAYIKKTTAVTGGPFQVLAWVRNPGDGGATGAFVGLEGYSSDGGVTQNASGTAAATAATWSLLQSVLPADAVTTTVSVLIEPVGKAGAEPWCILLDDVSLTQH